MNEAFIKYLKEKASHNAKVERNIDIFKERENGKSFNDIAKQFNISRCRAHYIHLVMVYELEIYYDKPYEKRI